MKKILIVVDIQTAYSPFFTEEYLRKVQNYVEKNEWDEVIIRYVGEDEYSIFDNKNEKEVIHTFYEESSHIPLFLNKKEYKFSTRYFGYYADDAEAEEIVELVPGKLIKVKDDGEWWYMSESPNGDSYCPTREIDRLLDEEDAEIHIIGGFRNQCVLEVYDFLKVAGLKNVYIKDEYCFAEGKPDVGSALRFNSNWEMPVVI